MTITIASGKGGTGKTTLAVNLAYVLSLRGQTVRLLDCDVEEPNDHLFVKPSFTAENPVTVPKPVWNREACTACGKCADVCNYNAIAVINDTVLIYNELCHSCGACTYICPEHALSETQTAIGMVQIAEDNQPFFFAHGLLNVGESLAPNVVRAVKAHKSEDAVNIIDASPGTACPVVEAVEGADAVLLVTEPTPFGLNDLKLAVGLTLKIGVPTGIVVNRSDGKDEIIADYAERVGLPITGRIPFKREYAETYSGGDLPARRFPEFRENLADMYDNLTVAAPPVPDQDVFERAGNEHVSFPHGTASSCKEVTIISGKGGTGKTTVTSCFAELYGDKVLSDNDVDAADLHLLLQPTVVEEHDFFGGISATIEPEICTGCGACADACHFNAIRVDESDAHSAEVSARTGDLQSRTGPVYVVDPLACEGCGLCPLVCPVDAIRTRPNLNGKWYVSHTDHGPLAHARLGIAEENSGRLVTQVRQRARDLADELHLGLILSDGPPGTGCPVIASVSGTDLVVVVTEPTVSGVHDMVRVMQLTEHFGIPVLVVINKADLNEEQAGRIDALARDHGSRVIGRIPFDRAVNDALMNGETIIQHGSGPAEQAVRAAWHELNSALEQLYAVRYASG